MSGAAVTETDDRGAAPAGDINAIDPETERIARMNGWKPREEFRGDPDKWTPADVFVARGFEVPAILQNRNKLLASKVDDLQRRFDEAQQESSAKLNEAVETVKTVTTMLRTSEQRAYERARRELKAEMEQAVANGDTATWNRLEQEREALESAKPPPAPAARETPPVPTPRANGGAGPTDPAVQRFLQDNPWYDPQRRRDDRDDEMMAYADTIHNGLLTTRPGITMEENLRIVQDEVRKRFPERLGRRTAPAPAADYADDNPAPNGDARRGNGAASDRRNESPAVIPSSGSGPAPRRGANRYTFDTMPQASKDAYTKYARLLEGKGPALTKEEWANDYWSQYRDDGSP